MKIADVAIALARFKLLYGSSPPEPLRVSDTVFRQLNMACRNVNPITDDDLILLQPETIYGLRIVVDESIPENRIGYLDSEGVLRFL